MGRLLRYDRIRLLRHELGTFLGTFAPWADHTRIAPNHLWMYLPYNKLIDRNADDNMIDVTKQ